MHRARIDRHGSPHGKARRKTTLERVWTRIECGAADDCWSWTGYHAQGYAKIIQRGKHLSVHRLVFEQANGTIPDGMQVDHICHNRGCVNPDHLRLATNKQNQENFTGLRKDNTSGHRGAHFHKTSGLWAAKVRHEGATHFGGYYKTPAEAGEAARLLRISLHTFNDLDRVA